MRDPIFSVMAAARIGLLWSDPIIGQALARMPIVEEPGLRQGIGAHDGKLCFDRDVVKGLTPYELKSRLVDIVRGSKLGSAGIVPDGWVSDVAQADMTHPSPW